MRAVFLVLFGVTLGFLPLNSSTASIIPQDLPKVFILGEFEQDYNKLVQSYDEPLLSVCDNNMDLAFEKWFSMLQEMEFYADKIEFDITGVKIWIHVFWSNTGDLKHIGYHLRPNSRNINLAEMSAFLSSFMNHYKFPVLTDAQFAHYSSANFPLLPKAISEK